MASYDHMYRPSLLFVGTQHSQKALKKPYSEEEKINIYFLEGFSSLLQLLQPI